MDRRKFLLYVLAGAAAAGTAGCTLGGGPAASPEAATPIGATPGGPAATPTARGDVPAGSLLGNENPPGFNVRYYKTFRAPDRARWQLTIRGLVDAPTTMTLDQIQANLPQVEQNTRMKCVECWSSRAVWGGFTYAALAALVKPQAGATHVYFNCEDDYYEALPISELEKERALFVTHMDGRWIGAKYGAPLRMIIPWLYGYKGAKAVSSIEFAAKIRRGYWSDAGPYTVAGNILAGSDTPLDLDGRTRAISGGEIKDY